jgi:hypothetical protein
MGKLNPRHDPGPLQCQSVYKEEGTKMDKVQDDMISLACWDCCAIYASPKNEPKCPNCGWVPKKLVPTKGDVWADPATVIVGVPYASAGPER